MKIKTSEYMARLAKAEKRGYERGLREGERNVWEMERASEKEKDDIRFREDMIGRISALEMNVEKLCKLQKVDKEEPNKGDPIKEQFMENMPTIA